MPTIPPSNLDVDSDSGNESDGSMYASSTMGRTMLTFGAQTSLVNKFTGQEPGNHFEITLALFRTYDSVASSTRGSTGPSSEPPELSDAQARLPLETALGYGNRVTTKLPGYIATLDGINWTIEATLKLNPADNPALDSVEYRFSILLDENERRESLASFSIPLMADVFQEVKPEVSNCHCMTCDLRRLPDWIELAERTLDAEVKTGEWMARLMWASTTIARCSTCSSRPPG
ncbi:hypothetical protein QFC21_003470 [Naganishia friedmannii]|uniref:Uncharacterized protein n=1 Tax=Naganishia friedmannii TaxID=89922 RepID=A0ACC2VR73_9TREE|nr:hypothetical protein QFC21_003470 [Naganishia friedmannii]